MQIMSLFRLIDQIITTFQDSLNFMVFIFLTRRLYYTPLNTKIPKPYSISRETGNIPNLDTYCHQTKLGLPINDLTSQKHDKLNALAPSEFKLIIFLTILKPKNKIQNKIQ